MNFSFSLPQIILSITAISAPLSLFISYANYSLTIPVSIMLFSLAICLLISNRIKANWPAIAVNIVIIGTLTAFAYNFNYLTYPNPLAVIWIIFALGLLPVVLISVKLFLLNKIWKSSLSSDSLLIFTSSLLPYILIISVLSAYEKNIIDVNNILSFVLMLNILIGLFSVIYKKEIPVIIAFIASCIIQFEYFVSYLQFGKHLAAVDSYVFWTLLIFIFFTIYPFVFRKAFIEKIGIWIVSALSGVFACLLIYLTVKPAYDIYYFLIPFCFFLFYLMFSMMIFKWQDLSAGIQRSRFSLFAGVTLFFIILIFTMQYFKYWFTFALSLEGLALILLNLKLKHRGLLITAFCLYLIAFVHLYALFVVKHYYFIFFIIAGAGMFIGAKCWAEKKDKIFINILYSMGGITFFLLLYMQIINLTLINKILLGFLYCIIYFALGFLLKSKNLIIVGTVVVSFLAIKFILFDLWKLHGLHTTLGTFAFAATLMICYFSHKRLKSDYE